MCEDSTCMPTPDEARALIRAGYGARLATYQVQPDPERFAWVGPAPAGSEGARGLPDSKRGCTFHVGGRCELHNLGLKPWEGRMAHHSRAWQPIRLAAMRSWRGKQFVSVLATLDRTNAAEGR
jgi:hypothetical protein